MSKESSIKVYAENFSGSDKPVNAIPVWIENASAISGGGGGSFDPTYMSGAIDNKLNKDEVGFRTYYGNKYVSGVSGNQIFSDKAVSASKSWEAYYATYDSMGYDISQTHEDLTALNSFVQSNSAQWSQGGGGSDTPELLDVVFHYNYGSYNNGEIINNTQSAIDVKFNLQTHSIPSDLIIDGSPYTWNQDPDNPNYYIISTSIVPGMSMRGIPLYHSNNNTNYDTIIINNTYSGKFGNRTLTLYGKNAYFSGGYAYPYNITKVIQGMQPQQLTSFNGNFSYSAITNDATYIEVYGQDDEGIPYDTYGSFISSPEPTVTSGDVFPPTTGLTQGSKYYLAWNTNNGGLYWEYVGN